MPSKTSVTITEKRREKKIPTVDILRKKYIGAFDNYFVFYDLDEKTFFAGVIVDTHFTPVVTVETCHIASKKFSIAMLYVHSKYRGKDLAAKFYKYLIITHGYTIISGSSQSKGGRSVWVKLSRLKGLDITLAKETSNRKLPSSKFKNGKFYATTRISIDNYVFVAKKSMPLQEYRYEL